MRIPDILSRLPRRFDRSTYLSLWALFQSDARGLLQLRDLLPPLAQHDLRCRLYRRTSAGLEFNTSTISLFEDDAKTVLWGTRFESAFRKALEFPIGKMSREAIYEIHEVLLPDFEPDRFREKRLAMCEPTLLKASEFYRENYRELGYLVRLRPAEIARIVIDCRWMRWEFAKTETFGPCLRKELPSKEGHAWIATWSPEGNDVAVALDSWLLKLNEGPVGPVAGWAGELFNEFCQIHPVKDGNGRTGAVLFHALLHQLGFRLPSLTVPDVCYPFPPRTTQKKNEIVEQGFNVYAGQLVKRVLWHHSRDELSI